MLIGGKRWPVIGGADGAVFGRRGVIARIKFGHRSYYKWRHRRKRICQRRRRRECGHKWQHRRKWIDKWKCVREWCLDRLSVVDVIGRYRRQLRFFRIQLGARL